MKYFTGKYQGYDTEEFGKFPKISYTFLLIEKKECTYEQFSEEIKDRAERSFLPHKLFSYCSVLSPNFPLGFIENLKEITLKEFLEIKDTGINGMKKLFPEEFI